VVPVSHLYYLADGQALVSSGGHAVAVREPGTFIGEMTAMHGDPANGTVKLIHDSRYWAIEAQRLRDLVIKDPEIGTALEGSFARNMRDKLERSNRFILDSGGVRRPSPPGHANSHLAPAATRDICCGHESCSTRTEVPGPGLAEAIRSGVRHRQCGRRRGVLAGHHRLPGIRGALCGRTPVRAG
jgi:hypothetical protein